MRVLLFLMLACAAGFAQAPPKTSKKAAPAKPAAPGPAAPQKRAIASIAVEGNRIFSKEQVLAVSGLKIGQLASRPEFDEARDRLVESGAFESVA